MRKMKNKKRLTGLVIAFLLVALTGSAFAFAPGILDVTGNIRLADAYVVWSNVQDSPGMFTPLSGEVEAIHSAQIVDARGRTRQRIEWNIYFTGPGFAMITATATNEAGVNALIDDFTVTWTPAIAGVGATLADFGLTVDPLNLFAGFVGTVIAPGADEIVLIRIDWDGTVPAGFNVPGDNVVRSVDGTDVSFGLAGTFVIEFDYIVAP